jgi:hypothetical protein
MINTPVCMETMVGYTSLSSKCNGGSPIPSMTKGQGRKPNTKEISDITIGCLLKIQNSNKLGS